MKNLMKSLLEDITSTALLIVMVVLIVHWTTNCVDEAVEQHRHETFSHALSERGW